MNNLKNINMFSIFFQYFRRGSSTRIIYDSAQSFRSNRITDNGRIMNFRKGGNDSSEVRRKGKNQIERRI